MISSKDISAVDALPVKIETQAQLRETLHKLLQEVHTASQLPLPQESLTQLEQMAQVCYRKLRRLQNLIATGEKQKMEAVDLCDLLGELACACDLALSGTNKRIHLLCEAQPLPVRCFGTSMLCAVMNMLSNALTHGESDEIVLLVQQQGRHVSASVRNLGQIHFPTMQKSMQQPGSGLATIDAVARRHGGQFLFAQSDNVTEAVLSLPAAPQEKSLVCFPDFVDYLYDRLSPVYVGLCGICRCPL